MSYNFINKLHDILVFYKSNYIDFVNKTEVVTVEIKVIILYVSLITILLICLSTFIFDFKKEKYKYKLNTNEGEGSLCPSFFTLKIITQKL